MPKAVLQRICWNTSGWQRPDGSAKLDKGYAGAHGYAHEEWNFQLSDAYKGHVYGYVYTAPRVKAGQTFDILFYAINPANKEKRIVGAYNGATLVDASDYKGLLNHFENSGILARRTSELAAAKLASARISPAADVRRSITKKWLKIKCPVDKVIMFPNSILLSDIIGARTVGHHFTTYTSIDISPEFWESILGIASDEENDVPDNISVTEKRRYRVHKRIERNPAASTAAKAFHGFKCQACDFDYSDFYGDLGTGFIEAHHLRPISTLQIGESVDYNAATDFAVLCSNCHRMIHRMDNPSDVAGLRALIQKRSQRHAA
ncbi:HNH endonuclease [Microvirga vignae]|uniref:HNH endonuclease n=1 Tax=Microvirga vignae TaxID=1225564 RepID=UPI00069BDCDB|nr:hypothetical protein [Microvirga vignae]